MTQLLITTCAPPNLDENYDLKPLESQRNPRTYVYRNTRKLIDLGSNDGVLNVKQSNKYTKIELKDEFIVDNAQYECETARFVAVSHSTLIRDLAGRLAFES